MLIAASLNDPSIIEHHKQVYIRFGVRNAEIDSSALIALEAGSPEAICGGSRLSSVPTL